MYIPEANKVRNPQKAFDLIDDHGFATVFTQKDGVPYASHLPVLLDRTVGEHGSLRSHMARANEQWRHLDPGQEMLTIFHGPHSYISPTWYVSEIAVPTWNYATVHVYGYPTVHEDREFLAKLVGDTTAKYEKDMGNPWKMALPEKTVDGLMKAIVGFTVSITRIEAKFKLGQNRSQDDQEKMLRMLAASRDATSQGLAAFIKAQQ